MTTPTTTITGRGAWTKQGGTTPYYELTTGGVPNVGSHVVQDPNLDIAAINYRAVNFGVQAIQRRINQLGYTPALETDGWFGDKTRTAVIWVQKKLGLVTGYTPGRVGMTLAKAMFRDVVLQAEKVRGIPGHHLGGIMVAESSCDPGAVGYSTPSDKGLIQFNLDPNLHTSYTVEDAFSPEWAIPTGAERLAVARAKYAGKGAELQDDCSIAQHNSPAWAEAWYITGNPPNSQIQGYVNRVKFYGGDF